MVRIALALSVLALTACDEAPPAGESDAARTEAPAADALPEGHPSIEATALPEGHPQTDGALSGVPVRALHTGTVKETMDAGGYTYVLLETEHETMWVAGPQATVAVGDALTVPDGAMMADFHSAKLDRTFDEILFVDALHPGEISPEAKACHDPEALTEVAEFTTPEDGLAITEVHTRKAELVGQRITVRGQVTKSSHAIMGTNWLHIQDGTGSVAGKTFDLTVTTANPSVEVGDVVLVDGVLDADVDFGAGYKYDIIVQGATVTVEPKGTVD